MALLQQWGQNHAKPALPVNRLLGRRHLQVLAAAFDAGEADAVKRHGFGHGQAFFQRFSHFARVFGVEPFGPDDVLALGGGQLLAGLGQDVELGVQVLVDGRDSNRISVASGT